MTPPNAKEKVTDHVVVDIMEAVPEPKPKRADIRKPTIAQHQYDNDFLHRVVEDAGRWAFGTVLVELWVLNEDRTLLERPDNGWWLDPIYHACGGEGCKLCRLVDASREDYVTPAPCVPGVGLPGALWAEVQPGNLAKKRSASTRVGESVRRQSIISGRNTAITSSGLDDEDTYGEVMTPKSVKWREVNPLANDPDQPWCARLKFLADCRLGWAAGVPFDLGGQTGIVVYMARDQADFRKLSNPVNEAYLAHATLLIGAAYSLLGPRRAAENARKAEVHATVVRVRNAMKVCVALGKPLDVAVDKQEQKVQAAVASTKMDDTIEENMCADTTRFVQNKLQVTVRKCMGANVKAPPPSTWEQTAWTFFAALATLLILTNINVELVEAYGSEYSIVLGPFGALMTLQYGLTAAPASQPRNALVGQTFALVIAQGIGQAENLDPWFKQSLATALAISVMMKLGVTHPPAGAAALLFSTGKYTWEQVAIMLMANVVAIICAAFFNNLSNRRQYPTFWGLGFLHRLIFGGNDAEKKKKET